MRRLVLIIAAIFVVVALSGCKKEKSQKKPKTSDVQENLDRVYKGAVDYYEKKDQQKDK